MTIQMEKFLISVFIFHVFTQPGPLATAFANLLISSLTGLPEVRDLLFRRGFRSEIIMKKKVEDEELYVLRICEKS